MLTGAAIGAGRELAGDAATGASNFSLVANAASVALLASGALPAAAFCKSAAFTADAVGVGFSLLSGDKEKITAAFISFAIDVAPGIIKPKSSIKWNKVAERFINSSSGRFIKTMTGKIRNGIEAVVSIGTTLGVNKIQKETKAKDE